MVTMLFVALLSSTGVQIDWLMHHEVDPGENLTVIARWYLTDVETLVRINPQLAKNPDLIRVGQKLWVPKITERQIVRSLGESMREFGGQAFCNTCRYYTTGRAMLLEMGCPAECWPTDPQAHAGPPPPTKKSRRRFPNVPCRPGSTHNGIDL